MRENAYLVEKDERKREPKEVYPVKLVMNMKYFTH